jgi:hypothetical protein
MSLISYKLNKQQLQKYVIPCFNPLITPATGTLTFPQVRIVFTMKPG